ncbi:MAG: sugar ABC transporter permease [Acidobacteria bacterium]|nr:sugar ABC transporter permease [Acidobacteriota bacterium]
MPQSLGIGPRVTGLLVALLLAFFLMVPFIGTVWKSLLQLDPARPSTYGQFVGVDNYRTLLTKEPEFRTSLSVSLRFVLIALVQCFLAFLLAVLFRVLWPHRLPRLLVLLLIFPLLLSPTLVALMGRLFLNDQIGVITRLLKGLHLLGADGAPLGNAGGVWLWVSVIDAWQWVPFTSLLFWLCLRLIPVRQLEAARVDGIGNWLLLRFVIIPYLSVPVTVVILFRLLEALRAYDLPQVLTGGGPGVSTLTTSIYAARITFNQQRFGVGAAHLVLIEVCAYALIVILASNVKSLRGVLRRKSG